MNLACLQGTKWKSTKVRKIGKEYKFYYCGSDWKKNDVVLCCEFKRICYEGTKDVNRLIAVK